MLKIRDIKGWEDYTIDTDGNVFSKRKNKYLKPNINKYGYCKIKLQKNKHTKMFSIHRLVAENFLENKDGLPQVNHKDGNKQNNNINNLEWCSAKYNMNYGTIKEKISKANSGKIASIDTRLKLSQNSKDRIWVNDGKVEKLIKEENKTEYCQWNIGRLVKEVI